MRLSTSNYAELSDILAEAERQRLEKERLKLREAARLTIDEHLIIINTVIHGHLGAKYIKIWYNVPDPRMSALVDQLSQILIGKGWIVCLHKNGFSICNVRDFLLPMNDPDYDEYPYRKYQFVGDETRVDSLDDWAIDRLMLFKDYIRVQLWELLIPKDRIFKS